MKQNIAIALLISNVSFAEAMRLNVRFMPDLDDENSFIKDISKKTSLSVDDEDMVKKVDELEKEQERKQQLMIKAHSKGNV